MENAYQSKSHCKYLLRYHVILVAKYRRKVFEGGLNTVLKDNLVLVSKRPDSKFEIKVMETDMDHVHMLIEAEPSVSPGAIVRRLKQATTFALWHSNPIDLLRFYRERGMLWSGGYFVCSTGDASTDTIRKYIENQG